MQTSTHATNTPITRLYPLDVSAPTKLETELPESQTYTTLDDDTEWIPQDAEFVELPKNSSEESNGPVVRMGKRTMFLPEDFKN